MKFLILLAVAMCPLWSQDSAENDRLISHIRVHVLELPNNAFFYSNPSSEEVTPGGRFDEEGEVKRARDDFTAFFTKVIVGYEKGYLEKLKMTKILEDADDMVFFSKCIPSSEASENRRQSLVRNADLIVPSVAHGLNEAQTAELTAWGIAYLNAIKTGVKKLSHVLRSTHLNIPERFVPRHCLDKWHDIAPHSPRNVSYNLAFVTDQYVDDKLHAMYERTEFNTTLMTNVWYGSLALTPVRNQPAPLSDLQIDAWIITHTDKKKDAQGKIMVDKPLRTWTEMLYDDLKDSINQTVPR